MGDSLRDALMRELENLPVVSYDDGYRVQALPKAALLDLLAIHPAQPAPDREAVRQAIADELDAEGVAVYGLTPKLTDVVMRALNGSGVDSSPHTCPGCGVKVIGNERCGDPTRAECAS